MHYVIGDVHGCYDDMITLIKKIENQDDDAKFYFVGDFIDRGPQVEDTIAWVLSNIKPNGKYQTVIGNHEDMIIEWFDKRFMLWYKQKDMYDDYDINIPKTNYDFSEFCIRNNFLTPEKLQPMIDMWKNWPTSLDIPIMAKDGSIVNFKLVHAWHNYNERTPWKIRDTNIWERDYFGNDQNDDIIIHGHTPTIADEYMYVCQDHIRPGMIDYRKNAINVDGGCVFGKYYPEYPCMLCGICLETLEEFYPYTLEERYYAISDYNKSFVDNKIEMYKKTYLQIENIYRKEMQERLLKEKEPQNV